MAYLEKEVVEKDARITVEESTNENP